MKKMFAVMLVAAVFATGQAQATVYTWTSTSSTDWDVSGNWSGGDVPASLSEAGVTDDSIVFSGTVLPISNIPSYSASFEDTIPMVINSGGTLSLDFSSNFDSSMWANANRTQITVGDGANAVTVNINNMTYFARNGFTSTYLVNAGSLLQFNGNLADYPDGDLNKQGVFSLDGGTIIVTGSAVFSFDTNASIDFTDRGGSFTMDFGGPYSVLADVTDDFGTVFEHSGGSDYLSAVDNLDGSFTVSGAAIYTWTSTSDTDWSSSGNWSGGNVPALLSDTATSYLGPGTDARIVLNGTVMPLSNIPNFGNGLDNDTIPMEIRRGGTLNLDFSSNFDSSMWAQASRTQLTVGDGTNAVTVNINNMTYFARNGFTSTYQVNAGSTLNINGNLAEFPDADANKKGVFTLNGGNMVVDGIATGFGTADFDDNTTIDFQSDASSFTMDFGGTYYNSVSDVTDDFGIVFLNNTGGIIGAVDNGDNTFTVQYIPQGTLISIQ